MNPGDADKQNIVKSVQGWLHSCVLGLSLCPYARVPLQRDEVRIAVYSGDQLAEGLEHEIRQLQDNPAHIETTLMVLASGLANFLDFNDCVGDIEDLLHDHYPQFQLASFHPAFLFGGEPPEDASHYTNRAPYPIVQLLRVDSVTRAVEQGDTLAVPERNMQTLRSLDQSQLTELFPWVAQAVSGGR